MSIFRIFHSVAACIIGALCQSCAPALITVPAGPGTVVDGAQASFVYFDASQQPCSLEPLTGLASIRGIIGGQPIDGRFTFAASAMRLRLESVGRMPRDFVFTSEESKAQLLYRGTFLVRDRSIDLIEAILGLPLESEDLRRVLTACPRISGSLDGVRYNDRWFQVRLNGEGGSAVYVQRDVNGIDWMIQAIEAPLHATDRWRVEFHRDANLILNSSRVFSTSWNGTPGERFDVRISFDRVRVQAQLPAETFRIASQTSPSAPLDGIRKTRPQSAPFLVDPEVN